MAPAQPRLRVLSVGGNAVSAFLSWRLQATNLCDVTLVWKNNFQSVAQFGISFRSQRFGNERFKPRHVVQNPEDAAGQGTAFDYVLLCVKALPDVYNLADIIQSVVVPQHTCIIVNTTNTLGVEKQLEERFPTNVVLSLVSGADLSQLGTTDFEHSGSTEIWVGPANLESKIPLAIQKDMSEALTMTLTTGQVECKVSENIRKQQYERMIGPIAFHPVSVLFETPVLSQLLEKPGVREMISGVIEELLKLARADKCDLPADFKQKTFDTMTQPTPDPSTMYQDFAARRPMEIETYLGAPCQLAKASGVQVPRLETLYSVLRHINATSKDRPSTQPQPPQETATTVVTAPAPAPASRMSSQPPRSSTGPVNGHGRGGPMRPGHNNMGPPPVRRGPPPVNTFRGHGPNGYPPRGPSQASRRPSVDDSGLDEFSHVVLYDDVPDSEALAAYGNSPAPGPHANGMRGRGGRRTSHRNHDFVDDDDDDDYYFDPMNGRGPPGPYMDPENLDMMSVTSRRAPRVPSQGQLRRNMYEDRGGGMMRPGSYSRPHMGGPGRHRTSAQLMSDMPMLGENILNNPMMGFSSNRYGTVDRKEMAVESRNNSLTAGRLHDMGPGGGAYPPSSRRASRSPGNPLSPPGRMPGRPSPPHDSYTQGQPRMGRPSPPGGGMQAPMARYPPGPGNVMHSHQALQEAGVSKPHPSMPTKSLTGSASASAGSGDSGSANIESEPSAHSSTSSFAPRAMMSVR